MAGGQAIDLANVGKAMNQAELEQMHSLKTGALIRAAVALGALSCPDLTPAQIQTLDRYAAKLGLASSDRRCIGLRSRYRHLGQNRQQRLDNDKPTYVKLMGLQAARTLRRNADCEAVALIEPFGDKALRLRQLAKLLLHGKTKPVNK